MVISFKTKKLEKQVSSHKEIAKHFGKNARKLERRITELIAADNLNDFSKLPGTGYHLLSGDRKNQIAVNLEHPFRLVFEPAYEQIPLQDNGELDLVAIELIEIIEIVDYH